MLTSIRRAGEIAAKLQAFEPRSLAGQTHQDEEELPESHQEGRRT
jgi:hypothetical protein